MGYIQYGELAWLQRQHWEYGKTYDKTDESSRVASTKDKQAVPSAHYSKRRSSAQAFRNVHIASDSDKMGKCIGRMQLKDSACDDNGCAGASAPGPALMVPRGSI